MMIILGVFEVFLRAHDTVKVALRGSAVLIEGLTAGAFSTTARDRDASVGSLTVVILLPECLL